MKTRRTWIALAAVALVMGGSYWQWHRLPRNELEVRGRHHADMDIVPRDRALVRPIVDFKMPVFGRVTLPKPADASPSEVAYLKAIPAIGGILRSRTLPAFREAKWAIDGSLYPAGTQDSAGVLRIAVPYVFGKNAKTVPLFLNSRDGWAEVVLPANHTAAPTVPTLVQEFGRLSVKLTPVPIQTTLPHIEFDVTVEGEKTGHLLGLRFSEGDSSWNDDPFYLYTGHALRLRLPVQTRAINIAFADCRETSLSIQIRRSKSGDFQGFSDGGIKVFQVATDYVQVAPGMGEGAIIFETVPGRVDFGIRSGLIEPSAWSAAPGDYTFLRALVGMEDVKAKVFTVGVASSRRLKLPRLDTNLFMVER